MGSVLHPSHIIMSEWILFSIENDNLPPTFGKSKQIHLNLLAAASLKALAAQHLPSFVSMLCSYVAHKKSTYLK